MYMHRRKLIYLVVMRSLGQVDFYEKKQKAGEKAAFPQKTIPGKNILCYRYAVRNLI